MTGKVWWLDVRYATRIYDMASADLLITGALEIHAGFDSGVDLIDGNRDLNFPFASREDAERVERKLKSSGIPMAFDTQITEGAE